MAKIDVVDVKKKILAFLDQNGPSLPVPIAKHVALQPMFASAILSELLNEKRVKTSSLKVGTSPLYLIPGQEHKLEAFADNLTGVEKEAYLILRDNKLLEDQSQEPRIRVAFRGLKDFAIPTQMGAKLFWKYFTVSNEKVRSALQDEGDVAIGERVVGQQIWEDIKKETPQSYPIGKTKTEPKMDEVLTETHDKIVHILSRESEHKKPENKEVIFVKEEAPREIAKEIIHEERLEVKPQKIRKMTEKEIFLDQVTRILQSKNIELLEVLQSDKKQILAKARVNVDQTCILYFIDKKRPDEKDMLKAYKKAQEYKLPYYLFTQTQPQKKLKETADLYKSLLGFGSIE
ncbi:MAG: hypothetical protein WCI72_01810 [archaeon]